MAEYVGSDESEFDSVTSSQKSFLKNCPFADPKTSHESPPTKSSGEVVETDSDSTEILGNQISPAVVRTPVLSFTSPTSLDSINDDDVFRTPPENASLSSAADSEPRVRVLKLKSPSSKTQKTPYSSSSSPSLPPENARVLKTKPLSATGVSKLKSPSSISQKTPVSSASPSLPPENVRVLETKIPLSATGALKSVAAGNVSVPGKHFDLDSPSPTAIGRRRVLEKQQISDSVGNTGVSNSSSPARIPIKPLNLAGSSSGNKISEMENPGGHLPFKEIIEALLRNSGENLNERDAKVSCVDILKNCGLKFPK